MQDFKEKIEKWIIEDLSKPLEGLNGLSRCPYAKKAFLDEKIGYQVAEKNLTTIVEGLIENWETNNKDIVVILLNWTVTPTAVEYLRTMCNDNYNSKDFFFVEDSVEDYNFILMQKKSKLETARESLKEAGYYGSINNIWL
jgi:predicted secreted protein